MEKITLTKRIWGSDVTCSDSFSTGNLPAGEYYFSESGDQTFLYPLNDPEPVHKTTFLVDTCRIADSL